MGGPAKFSFTISQRSTQPLQPANRYLCRLFPFGLPIFRCGNVIGSKENGWKVSLIIGNGNSPASYRYWNFRRTDRERPEKQTTAALITRYICRVKPAKPSVR